MWSRAVRLNFRHLLKLHDTGPIVLLFADGGAGLLTGANADEKVVFIRDPMAPEGEAAVPVDELRLAEVWSGEAILLRAEPRPRRKPTRRSRCAGWPASCCSEKRSLRDIGIASLHHQRADDLPAAAGDDGGRPAC